MVIVVLLGALTYYFLKKWKKDAEKGELQAALNDKKSAVIPVVNGEEETKINKAYSLNQTLDVEEEENSNGYEIEEEETSPGNSNGEKDTENKYLPKMNEEDEN